MHIIIRNEPDRSRVGDWENENFKEVKSPLAIKMTMELASWQVGLSEETLRDLSNWIHNN